MNISVINGRLADIPKFSVINIGTRQIGVCYFTVACMECMADDGINTNNTDFFECLAFDSAGQQIAEKFTKGSKVMLRGHFKNHRFKDYNGTKHFTNVFVVESAEHGDTDLKKTISKNSDIEAAVTSNLSDIYHLYNILSDQGYLCVNEDAYYNLASSM